MDEFTKRFNKVIDESGLSGVQISEMLQIHPPTLVKYKTGKSLMSMQTLYNFCRTFNVSADWLMGLDTENVRVEVTKGKVPVYVEKDMIRIDPVIKKKD